MSSSSFLSHLFLILLLPFSSFAQPDTYVVEYIANAATGVDMNNNGDVIGTSRGDPGCGSTCLPPQETVVWKDGVRIVLPLVPGFTDITVTGMNNAGWIVGHAGLYTPTHAVVWKPVGGGYQAIDLGNLPGKTISTTAGIDDFGRVVGWSTTQNFPPSGAPFLWTETGGMVDLSQSGFPNEQPMGISPGGMVATYGYWYHLDDPGSAVAVNPPPRGFLIEASRVAINNAGDQARFLVSTSSQNLVYPFRYNRDGTWQQISFAGTGHLSTYGMGSINDAKDVTVTVQSTAQIAYGPAELAQPLAPLVSSAFGGGPITFVGRMNDSGQILAKMIIGQSGQRLVRLVPSGPCASGCIRVTTIQMRAKGPAYCDQGNAQAKAKVTVADEAGNRLAGVTLTAHFFDDYWLDEVVTARTNSNGQAVFMHTGPPCVGAIAVLITDAAVQPTRVLDGTTGQLSAYAIPLPGGVSVDHASFDEPELEETSSTPIPAAFGLSQNFPNPFNPSTTIGYQLPEDSHVRLTVSDVMGRVVTTLVDGFELAGEKFVTLDATGMASGVYFYRLEAGRFVQTKKLVLMR